MTEQSLPHSKDVNVGTLVRIFSNTTNSYKYLFFLALLSHIEKNYFADEITCSVNDLTIDMLAIAWYPHTYFKLNFGSQDKVHRLLNQIEISFSESLSPQHYEKVRAAIAESSNRDDLARYVPYRLIRPFFELETRGVKDDKVNGMVAELSRGEFAATVNPLYRFSADERSIIVSPSWLTYLKMNLKIVKGWALWQWLKYMQKLNPSVPNVAAKLEPPLTRSALKSQENFWRKVLEHSGGFRCIYSGQLLDSDDLSLDHFLPWSFVAHDELWNLIPTAKSTNSSKSNFLPAVDYLEPFIQSQHSALIVAKQHCSAGEWSKAIEPYSRDLRMGESELLDKVAIREAYVRTMEPLMKLASANGFASGWLWAR